MGVNTNQFDYVSSSAGCLFNTGTTQLTCPIGDLAPGASSTSTVSLRILWTQQNGEVDAQVWSGNDANTSNNTALLRLWPYTPPQPPGFPPKPIIGTSQLPDGQVGVPYQSAIGISGGTPPYVVQTDQAFMPPGLTLSSDGVVSGTPTEAAQWVINISVQDGFWKLPNPGLGALGTVHLTIAPAPAPPTEITPDSNKAAVWALSFTSTVHAGRYAQLTVGVTPTARCAISVRYAGKAVHERALAPKYGGRLSWRWLVASHTTPGRWPVNVDCGQAKLSLHQRVVRR